MNQLYELARPFPKRLIHPAPKGKYGDYVSHSTVNEALLYDIGPHSFEVIELIRGHAEEVKGQNQTYPARDNAVVGCLARLICIIDGRTVTITEAGDVEQAAMNNDGRNAKDASSDAYKRCAMRAGKGLHLWSGSEFFLAEALRKRDEDDRETTDD